MPYLRQNTATTLIIGPFKDKTDGVTSLTAMEVSATTIIDFYKGATKSDVTTTSAATHAMVHVANGYYSLTVTTGDVDTAGFFKITGDAVSALAVWRDFEVLPTQQYDTMFGGGGMAAASTITGVAQASAIAIFTASVFANLSYASQVAGVAQASSVAAFSASVFATLASHTVSLASVLSVKQALVLLKTTIASAGRSTTGCALTTGSDNNNAYVGMQVVLDDDSPDGEYVARTVTGYTGASKAIVWTPAITESAGDGGDIYIIPSDTRSMAYSSTVTGVAQASSLSIFNASVFATLASHTVTLASTLAYVQNTTATTVWAYTVGSAQYSYAHASTVAGVAQASSVAILGASVFATLASHTVSLASTLAWVQTETATTIWAYTVGSAPYSYAYASQVAGVAQASSLAAFSVSAMLNLAYGSTVSAGTDASVVWAYGTRTLTAGGGGDTATTVWSYIVGSAPYSFSYASTVAGVAQASSLSIFNASVFATLASHTVALASTIAWVQTETATSIWAYTVGSAPYSFSYSSTVAGVAQASVLAGVAASTWGYAARTLTAGGGGDTATTIWSYTVGSAPYSFAHASTVAGVAQASSFALVASTVWEAVRAQHTTVGTFGEVASVADMSTAVWAYGTRTVTGVTDGAQASQVTGVAQASSLAAFSASVFATLASHTVALASTIAWVQTETATTIWAYTVGSAIYSIAQASTVTGVAQASSLSIFNASVFATLASHTVTLASTLAYVKNTTATTIWSYTVGSAQYSYAYASTVAGVAQASVLAGVAASTWGYAARTLTAGGGGDTATTIWAYPQGSTVGSFAQASSMAAFSASVFANLAYGSAVAGNTDASVVWAYGTRTLTAGGSGDTATTIWAYPQGSAVGYAYGSTLTAFSASAMLNLAYGSTVTGVSQASSLAAFNASVFATLASHTVALASTLAWVQTETATSIWGYTVGSAQYSYAYASTVNGVAQASSLSIFGASVFSTLASHTVALASTLAYVQNTTATTIWSYTVGSAQYSYAYASTVAGVAQASALSIFNASVFATLASHTATLASTLVIVQNAAMASTVNGVAQATTLAAFSASAMLNLAYSSTVTGVAQASTMAAFSASVMANVAYGSAVSGVASSMLATLYEGTHTFSDYLRVTGAVMAGKTSGGGTASVMFFSIDGVTARVAAVVDANNNRTSVVTVTG